MSLDTLWLVLPLLFGCFAACIAAFSAWNRNYIRGNQFFSCFLVGVAWWAFAYGLELFLRDPAQKLVLAKLQYLAIPFTTPLAFLFVGSVTGLQWIRRPLGKVVLLTVPILSNLIVWLRTELIWSVVNERDVYGVSQLSFEYGSWFYVMIASQYIWLLGVFGLIIHLVFRSPALRRIDGVVLVIGVFVPFVLNLLYVAGVNLLPGYDLTPLALVTFGLMSGWALFEFRPNDIMPVVYKAAFGSLPDPALTLDENDRVKTVNPAAEHHFARLAADLNGLHIRDLLPEKWLETIDSAETENTLNLEVRKPEHDTTRYYDLRVTPILDTRNRYKGRLIVIRDITMRKRALMQLAEREQALSVAVADRTAELQSTNAELIRAVQLKDEFLASMSHELRTPLSAVIGTTEALQSDVYGPVAQTQRQPLDRIEQSAEHLMSLINDILNMSKIEAGQFMLRVSPVNIVEMCQTCVNQVRPDADRKGIMLISAFEIQQQTIIVDERRTRQVLINLLSNAVKFTPVGQKIGLTVRENPEAQQTQFVVWDTGIGISEEDQARIFRPFVQVDSSLSREYEGTGLGLALSKGLAEMHGGKIELLSEAGVGSRFTFVLPWDSRITATVDYEETSPHALGVVV